MALERIDPILLEDLYAVDHLLRYALVAPLAEGCRVMDAACGSGFGSALLALSGAREVIGRDLDAAAVEACQRDWKLPNASFAVADLACPLPADAGTFDRVVSFETLEHVADPDAVLGVFSAALAPEGLLIGSVPGETDRQELNPFHLHYFDPSSLEALLKRYFPEVLILRQSFRVASFIGPADGSSAEPLSWESKRHLKVDFGTAGNTSDSLFFIAGRAALPALEPAAASSRRAWELLSSSLRDNRQALQALSEKHRQLFHEHSDLKIKFTHMLAWGKWHFEELNGKKPEPDYLQRIANATSQREAQLRDQVSSLQEQILLLQRQLADLQTALGHSASARRAGLSSPTFLSTPSSQDNGHV